MKFQLIGRYIRMKRIFSGLLLLLTVIVPVSASAVTIDFEGISTQNFGSSTVIDGVTFSIASPSSSPEVRVFNDGGVRTAYILGCELPGGGCVENLEVDFGQAVSNLSFDFLADESATLSGTVSAYLNNVLLSTINLVGDGDGYTHEFLSLAALGAIDKLLLNPTSDPGGIGYDNFSFDVSAVPVSAVPVPAAVWLFGTALIGLIGFGKRRKAA